MRFLENIVRGGEKAIRSLRHLKTLETLALTVLHKFVAELHAGVIEEFSYISLLAFFTYEKYVSGIGYEEVLNILHYYQFVFWKNDYVVATVV